MRIDEQLKEGRLLALLPTWKKKHAKLFRDVETFAIQQPSYLALSWGKQSICLAFVVAESNLPVDCIFWRGEDSEILDNFCEVRDQFMKKFPFMAARYYEEYRGVHLKPYVKEFEEKTKTKYRGQIVGLAASESRARKITCSIADKNNVFVMMSGMRRLTPLALWTDEDIAAFIATHNVPLLNTYRRFGLESRTASGSRPGSYTEKAVDRLPSSAAAEIRKRWQERGLLNDTRES